MRVLGIDCGTEYTGYGVVELCDHDRLICLTCGAVKLSPRDPLPRRLAEIPEPADAADALAIAICHLHTSATLERQKAAAR